ncbi:MAG: ACT domain-containing protein [Chloroflexi bacterium]|nr:ACT domain-containing protein [Chloroflexota bacterium]
MAQTVQEALQQTRLYSDNLDYTLLKLPPNAITAAAGIIAEIGEPFNALIVDRDEVSLIIPAEAVADFIKRLPGHTTAPMRYRLITLDVVLELSLTGYLAAVGSALAAAGVPILACAAYSRDHLLVPADQFDLAMKTLETLKSGH